MGDIFKYVKDKSAIGISVVLALISVFAGLVPYVSAAKLLTALVQGTITSDIITLWGLLAIGGYIVKTLCMTGASSVSHRMAYSTIQYFVLPHLHSTVLMMLSVFAISFRRLLPCVMAGSLLLGTVTASELMHGLQKLKVPRAVTIPLAVTMRYLPAVREEIQHIHDAKKLRKLNQNRNPFRNLARTMEYYYVPLLISAAQMSDEITAAAVTRGIENPETHTSLCQMHLHVQDYLVYLILLGLFVMICLSG